ncbi:dihydrolipoyl dehydrogenase [Methylobacterium platani]|uniref:Pyridine nucleotide-disulfide oxidoreductase n=2 Tax=Methylobacterium platani TaxID=427683 RepID=A0A179S3E5_9HYPH|nr:dihydrolipoyl dehydrogenase [Methylobacterium platani]KMO11186.1 pyridine nucleotide-disulfide oxidoreductase [Methylobacterium platani JCM 14648]OAS18264.1 pyridine nucleotide-disulfide oxidoreductase [Methylobacterium platani]
MRELACDVAVIGAGTAGIAARSAAEKAGARAVLIERGPGGTTCARVGCMPSKLLIEAGRAAHDARETEPFGVAAGAVRVDGAAVMRRVRRLRDDFVASVFAGLDAVPEELRVSGTARFADTTTLLVDDHTRISAGAVVIATGSSPSLPPPLRPVADRVLTTDTLFEIETLPESLAVLGAGAVGLELAQAMARLGVRVTLIDPAAVVGGIRDPEVAACAAALLGPGIDLHLGATVDAAERVGDEVRLTWHFESGGQGGGTFARVLAAAGRPPNLSELDLAAAGLALDEDGLPDFNPRTLQCGTAPIFIAGDANQEHPVLHEAQRQGWVAGGNAARFPQVEAPPPWPAFSLVFTDPQIAAIGRGFDAEAARDWVIGETSFADQGRARAMDRAAGLIRVYAEPDGRLTGAAMIGPGIEHLAHLMAVAVQEGWSAATFLDRPFYHPTLEEGLSSAVKAVAERTGGTR